MNRLEKIKSYHDKVCALVCKYYDITFCEMFGCNRQECVDARYIAIGILCERYTDIDIAKVSCLSKSCVNKIRNAIQYDYNKKKLWAEIDDIKAEIELSMN